MTQNQHILQQLSVSGLKLDELISASYEHGAYGAKLSGAGGGDCMIAVTAPEQRAAVEQAITEHGGQVMPVAVHAQGVRIEDGVQE